MPKIWHDKLQQGSNLDVPLRFNPTQKVKNCMTRVMLPNRTLHISVIPCLSATECDDDLFFDKIKICGSQRTE